LLAYNPVTKSNCETGTTVLNQIMSLICEQPDCL